ncbi:MAG TPA: TonB-dependent receptor [Vicinamibacterales bacterium]|nr:TonB-dependent receptor [Vicinamibacterales bacterium]
MRRRRVLFVASVLCACAVAPAIDAGAEQPGPQLKHLSLEELGQIVVTSVSKEPEEVWQTPAAIFVITHDDIVRSGATSIPDVLRLAPGVEVARIDSSRNWVVGVRGFGDQFSKSLLVLIDGRSLYTPLFGGVHWSLQNIMLEDIERIEIIRGPGSTVWGANAVDGVINIITRTAAQTQGTYVSAATGNVDEAIGSVRYGGRIKNAGSYRAYGTAFERGPEWHSDGRDFDRWHMVQGGFRADFTSGVRDAFTLHGDAYAGQIGESVLVSTFNPPARGLVDDPLDVSGQNVVGRWDRKLPKGAGLSVQAYWDRTYRLGTDFGETRNTFDVDAVHQFSPASHHKIIWGGGFRHAPATYVQTIESADFQPHDQAYDLSNIFAQDTIALPWRLSAAAGARVEHNTYTGVEFSPSASLRWTPTGHQSAWFAVTRTARTPSRLETDISVEQFAAVASGIPVYARLLGDRQVDAEHLFSVEGGYRALLAPAVYVDVALFRHRYDDVISLGNPSIDVATRDGTTYERVTFPFANVINGPTRGIEIAPHVSLSSSLSVRGSYSYFGTDLAVAPGTSANNSLTQIILAGTPHHQVVIQGIVSHTRLEITPAYRYVSERKDTSIPSYQELDIPVMWRITPALAVRLVGQNLLHAHHAEWARDPGPTVEIKRAAYVGVTWTK